MSKTVWICGYHPTDEGGDDWVMVGVYTTEEKAKARCEDIDHFIAPVELDADPEESGEWPGYYRPLAN